MQGRAAPPPDEDTPRRRDAAAVRLQATRLESGLYRHESTKVVFDLRPPHQPRGR